jgi:hypothetical protein
MTHMLSILPILACAAMVAMMFGAGALAWLSTRTPLGRVLWFGRRARPAQPKVQRVERDAHS